MNVAIFWAIAPCSAYVNKRFGGTYHLHLQGRKSAEQETSLQQLAGLVNLILIPIDSVHSLFYAKVKTVFGTKDSKIRLKVIA
jgi:hypothetical protein